MTFLVVMLFFVFMMIFLFILVMVFMSIMVMLIVMTVMVATRQVIIIIFLGVEPGIVIVARAYPSHRGLIFCNAHLVTRDGTAQPT